MAPESVLHDIENGTVTEEQIKAVKNVYPQWYQTNIVLPFGAALRARDAARKPLLPIERQVVDTSLGIHSGVDSDDFVKKYAPTFANAVNLKPQPNKPSGRKSSVASRSQTQTSKILGPIE